MKKKIKEKQIIQKKKAGDNGMCILPPFGNLTSK